MLTSLADLSIIGVDPSYHRRGIGRVLVQWGLDTASAQGKQVFLAATPAGKFLYESMGFKPLGEPYELAGETPDHCSMLWTPCQN